MSCVSGGALNRLAQIIFLAAVLALLAPAASSQAAESYRFDLEEIEPRPFTYGGWVQLLGARQRLNTDAAQYHLQYFDRPREQIDSGEARLHLDLGYRAGWLGLVFRGEGWRADDYRGSLVDTVVQEAFLTAQPAPVFTLDVGKRVARWGKGYAWNPIAFVDRPKNPDDPELAQEGFVMARAVGIQSFSGALKTLELTVVALPVREHLNEDFGPREADNAAAKLYALLWDTDLDLAVLSAGTRTWRYGADFSRNMTPSFEIHGEWAAISGVTQPVAGSDGAVTQRTRAVQSWLAGIRYLTEFELTAILEYYFNGAGYSAEELEALYRIMESAYAQYAATGKSAALKQATTLAQGALAQPTPGREYTYLRLSQKEPFGWLYVTPALTMIRNLQDGSSAITAELAYTGVTNLELRARLTWLSGAPFTDYGERPNAARAELRVRYAF